MQILSIVLDICLLRRGPQAVPAGWRAATWALAIYVAVSITVSRLTDAIDNALLPAALSAGLLVAIAYAVLRVVGHSARVPQTVTALAATGALLSLLILPALMTTTRELDTNRPADMASVAYIATVFVWSFAVDAHIYRHALSTSFTVGVLISVLWFSTDLVVWNAVQGLVT